MANEKCDGKDVIHVGPVVDSGGTRACIRHTRDHQVIEGFVRPVKDGQALYGKETLVNLTRREDDEGTYDVEEVYGQADDEAAGPAMVNSENYKSGWDRIFGNRTVGVA